MSGADETRARYEEAMEALRQGKYWCGDRVSLKVFGEYVAAIRAHTAALEARVAELEKLLPEAFDAGRDIVSDAPWPLDPVTSEIRIPWVHKNVTDWKQSRGLK